jgi:hypothetical protein
MPSACRANSSRSATRQTKRYTPAQKQLRYIFQTVAAHLGSTICARKSPATFASGGQGTRCTPTPHRYRILADARLIGSNLTCCHDADFTAGDSNNTRSKIIFRTSASRRVAKARLNCSHSLPSRTSMYCCICSGLRHRRKGSGPPLRRKRLQKNRQPVHRGYWKAATSG